MIEEIIFPYIMSLFLFSFRLYKKGRKVLTVRYGRNLKKLAGILRNKLCELYTIKIAQIFEIV